MSAGRGQSILPEFDLTSSAGVDPAGAALDGILTEVQRMLLVGGMPVELVTAVVGLARKGAGGSSIHPIGPRAPGTDADLERLWSVRELARYLDLHERTVIRHMDAGRLRSMRVGRQRRVRQRDLDVYLARDVIRHDQNTTDRSVVRESAIGGERP